MNNLRKIEVVRKNERQKLKAPKPKRWSHQDDLDAALGKTIELFLGPADVMTGVLLAADQFTFKIGDPKSKSVMTYFKHAVQAYEILED